MRPYYASPALQDYMGRHRPTYQLPEETGLSPDISPSHIRSPSPEADVIAAADDDDAGLPRPHPSGDAPPRIGQASLGKGD